MKAFARILTTLLFVCTFQCAARAQTSLDKIGSQEELEKTIAALDTALFTAYNTCDLAKFKSMLADDVEFYHDKAGITLGKENLTEAIRNNICGKVTRELVGKLEVYPMKGIGAVEIGIHRFHHPGEQNGEGVGEAQFIHLWVYKDGAWKVSRVLSFDHHAATK